MRSRLYLLAPCALALCAALLSACGGAAAPSTTGNTAAQYAPAATAAPAPSTALDAEAAPNVAAATAAEPTAAAAAAPAQIPVSPYVATTDDHLSTFALDVDTGSYTVARNAIRNGQLPPADTVRVEEFVNYFRYGYPEPSDGAFAIQLDAAPSPFDQRGAQIVRVGLQGMTIDASQRSDAALTFVVDASGSMDRPNRLPLVQESLRLLAEQLRPSDQVAIVVFGSSSYVALEPTPGGERDAIERAIDGLRIDGSTNLEEGMWQGYKLATDHFKVGGNNRVILLTDGEANIGATTPDAILARVRDYAAQGVYLSTVGFGMGDYNDALLEQLADDGNGNYSYVDTREAAQRTFVENLTGTLQVIAKDAKVQVDFNPQVVSRYRLLGYENRAVADADFRNDRVDAGEVGAGHSVTALYEVTLTGQATGTAMTVRLRYADPRTGEVREQERALSTDAFGQSFAQAPASLQLATAAAAFAQYLRGDAQSGSAAGVRAIIERIAPQLANDPDVQELLDLVRAAESIGGNPL
jgi:Ca-activated chloride channel family protein